MTITLADNGKSIILKTGASLLVKLSAQIGTGYSWAVVGDVGPELALTDSRTSDAADHAAGSAQTQEFRFEARAVGKRDLKFDYRRPWEKDVPAAQTFHVDVTVK